MDLAEKLIVLRKKQGLSQIELAEKLNVSRQAVSRWETGAAMPSTENLKMLRELYGVSIDYLLDEKTEGEEAAKLQTLQGKNCVNKRLRNMAWVCTLMVVAVIIIGVFILCRGERAIPIGDLDRDVEDNYSEVLFDFDV